MADLDQLSLAQLDRLKSTPSSTIPFDPAWRGSQRRWQAHRSGDLYVLQVVNRTTGHKFQVHQYGKNAWQASLRYYRGFQGHGKRKRDSWVWQCTKVVSAKLLTTK
mgnify:FL=1